MPVGPGFQRASGGRDGPAVVPTSRGKRAKPAQSRGQSLHRAKEVPKLKRLRVKLDLRLIRSAHDTSRIGRARNQQKGGLVTPIAQAVEQFDAAHSFEAVIRDDEVKMVLAQHFQSVLGALRGTDLFNSNAVEQGRERTEHARVIFDHQN